MQNFMLVFQPLNTQTHAQKSRIRHVRRSKTHILALKTLLIYMLIKYMPGYPASKKKKKSQRAARRNEQHLDILYSDLRPMRRIE